MCHHVEMTTALLALDHPYSTELGEALVEELAVRQFTNGKFTAEKFHRYSAWLLRASRLSLHQYVVLRQFCASTKKPIYLIGLNV